MSSRLDDVIGSARERVDIDSVWSADREGRVRACALVRRGVRVRRDRALRRGALVVGGAGLLVLALLRGASSAPATPAALPVAAAAAPAPTAEALASRELNDAGYFRD